MKYLYILDDTLLQGPPPTAADLKNVMDGELFLVRVSHDNFEVARVTSRPIDAPTNSFDETRYDSAIGGQIYEIEGWEALEEYSPEPVDPANAGVHVVGEGEDQHLEPGPAPEGEK